MAYAERTDQPPPTLTDAEVRALLKVTGRDREGFRDHVIIAMALDLGLRQAEIVALDVADVANPKGRPKWVIQLREFKRAAAGASRRLQRCHVPDRLYYKLAKYLRIRLRQPGTHNCDECRRRVPLFVGRGGERLSTRSVRKMFRRWQREARLDQLYGFHRLRATAITKVRRSTGSIRLAQRFARHANIRSTTIYDYVSDEEVAAAVRGMSW